MWRLEKLYTNVNVVDIIGFIPMYFWQSQNITVFLELTSVDRNLAFLFKAKYLNLFRVLYKIAGTTVKMEDIA